MQFTDKNSEYTIKDCIGTRTYMAPENFFPRFFVFIENETPFVLAYACVLRGCFVCFFFV